jgi:hypothetical protein
MSDLLAVFDAANRDQDRDLIDEIAAHRPHRITVLIEDPDTGLMSDESDADALRDRLARLMATIEARTGATVLGLAGQRSQLIGWRFDRELAARTLLTA